MLESPKVYIEGVEVDPQYIENLSLSLGHNRFMSASLTLSFLPDKFSPIRIDRYANIVIELDGYVYFKGVIVNIAQQRSPQGVSLNIQAVSPWELLRTLSFILINPVNLAAYLPALVAGQNFGYLVIAKWISQDKEVKSSVINTPEALFYKILQGLWKKIKENKAPPVKDFKPVKEFLQALLDIHKKDEYWRYQVKYVDTEKLEKIEQKGEFELATRKWWQAIAEKYKLTEYLAEYSPYTAALFKFFYKSLRVENVYKLVFENALTGGSVYQQSVMDLLMSYLGLWIANFMEIPTPNGPQVVIKPQLESARPPKPNVIPKELVLSVTTQSNLLNRPTRVYVEPTSAGLKIVQGALAKAGVPAQLAGRFLITAYPEEVEYQALYSALKLIGKKVDKKMPLEDLAYTYYVASGKDIPPKPYGAVLTSEEEKRGIVAQTVRIPDSLADWYDALKTADKNYRFWQVLYAYAKYAYNEQANQTNVAQLVTPLNLYAMPGHTVLFEDNDRIYMGYLTDVVHQLTPDSGSTVYRIIGVRDITDELVEYLLEPPSGKEVRKGKAVSVEIDKSEFFGEELTFFDMTTKSVSDETIETFDQETLKDYYKLYGTEPITNEELKSIFIDRDEPDVFSFVAKYGKLWWRKLKPATEDAIKEEFKKTVQNEEFKEYIRKTFGIRVLPDED
jgi:hypothetical protein